MSANNYQTQKTTLIPEDFIIYKTERKPISQKIINMSSNGHAMGNSYKEAVIFSLFEMYERDYFLFHWYEKRVPKEVYQASIFDAEINYYLMLIKDLGYEVSIYQLLSNKVMNIYWTLARGKNSNKFATYSTAGAHLFGRSAIISALKELYFALYVYNQDVVQIQANGHQMRPQDVTTVADHAIYYSVEERSQNFDFLKEAEMIEHRVTKGLFARSLFFRLEKASEDENDVTPPTYIITNSFKKKTNKTPTKELKKAINRKLNYRNKR
ncbi:hypothetical protein GPU31_08640 [Streptococcus thermophilus]|nr:hypothetical protein [Streptococcus thermophilus]